MVLTSLKLASNCYKDPSRFRDGMADFGKVKFELMEHIRYQIMYSPIDLLAILQKCLNRALFLYIFIHEVRLSGVRAPITIVHIRKFYEI